ncbi:STAS domain-containing protein [Streptomyces sp. TLI_171]|uniref:STAS domain-containing protein n=1 Tax=Streptomyces sp. TLI_171 TaxID=1938859 RepID=UPI001181371C|nr:STAS domain-containing protein [Streptomyces sp. TLI_171]
MSGHRLKASTRRVGPMVVCSFSGDVVQEAAAVAENVLDKALAEEPAVLGVDLSGVGLFTSTGLNVLIQVRKRAAATEIPLVLIAPSLGVRRVLELTETGFLFPAFDTAEQAVSGLDGLTGGRGAV